MAKHNTTKTNKTCACGVGDPGPSVGRCGGQSSGPLQNEVGVGTEGEASRGESILEEEEVFLGPRRLLLSKKLEADEKELQMTALEVKEAAAELAARHEYRQMVGQLDERDEALQHRSISRILHGVGELLAGCEHFETFSPSSSILDLARKLMRNGAELDLVEPGNSRTH